MSLVIGVTSFTLITPYTIFCFFFQAEDGIRDAQESRGLGDVYKRQQYFTNIMKRFGHKGIKSIRKRLDKGGSAINF